mgnify:CR=1 FL=1
MALKWLEPDEKPEVFWHSSISQEKHTLSGWQALIVSTATRVGMGNLAGVVAAISAGGAGAVFWMWITALIGASSSFVESVLAQKYKVEDQVVFTGAVSHDEVFRLLDQCDIYIQPSLLLLLLLRSHFLKFCFPVWSFQASLSASVLPFVSII